MVGAAVTIGPRGELFVAGFPEQMIFTRREGAPDEKGTDPIAPRSVAVRSEPVAAMTLMLK
jgi:hypothetical protein